MSLTTYLANMRSIAEAATSGRWTPCIAYVADEGYTTLLPTADERQPATNHDMAHIARFDPATVLRLLDVVEAVAEKNLEGICGTKELSVALDALHTHVAHSIQGGGA